MIKRVALACAALLVLAMFVPVAKSVPEPPLPSVPQPPIVGRYCVVTSDAAKAHGMPQGMTMWMSMNMKNPNGEGADWACADMPNPYEAPH
jgi:hypothetical protein